DIEIYPQWFLKNFFLKSIIGASHHSLHHKHYKYNFGLYFTWWDKLKKTESPEFSNKQAPPPPASRLASPAS
ncbi:MAG: sterol desaturase family protein, partial [Ferruginibacter sp.]|nr:sterol desaturase family protein [Chitinophagaceae bacterium]